MFGYCFNYFRFIYRLLYALESIAASIPIGNSTEPVIIARNSFAVSAQKINRETFQQFGQTFNAQIEGSFSDNTTINRSDLVFRNSTDSDTASIHLPNNLFDSVENATNQRVTHSVFLNDALFLRRNDLQTRVGSIIISATVVAQNLQDLNPPIEISFAKNPVRNISMYNYVDY